MSDDLERPRVLISDRQSLPVDQEALVGLACACLAGEGAGRSELSVSLVTADEMADLHLRYMGEEGPTDVLAFPLDEEEEEEGGRRVLGDVVICPEVAAGNTPDLGAELRLLLVHGILHLLGHDHERDEERGKMWARQERYTGVRVP